MKKTLIVSAVLIVALAALAVAGFAYAQSQNPPAPQTPPSGQTPGQGAPAGGQSSGSTFTGMMGGRGRQGMAMMSGWNGEEGPMHDDMIAAFAAAFEMTPEALQARIDAGDTLWTVAQEKGLTQEQFQALMVQARTTALNNLVEAGTITQAQADFMLQRMAQMQAGGFGPGSCMGTGTPQTNGRGGGGMGRGGMMGRFLQGSQQAAPQP